MLQGQTVNFEYSVKRYEPGLFMPLHAHDFSKISMVLKGAVTEGDHKKRCVCLPGSVATKPAGYDHTDEVSPFGLTILTVRPRPRTAMFQIWDRIVASYGWWQDPALTKDMVSLYRDLRSRMSDTSVENATVDILATLPNQTSVDETQKPKWTTRALEEIDQAPNQDWSILAIAEQLQLHPVYVSRTFRKALGQPLSHYLQRKHIQQAALLLGVTSQPPAEIAIDSGFADQAHMNRCFKAHFGMTPLEYRRLMA